MVLSQKYISQGTQLELAVIREGVCVCDRRPSLGGIGTYCAKGFPLVADFNKTIIHLILVRPENLFHQGSISNNLRIYNVLILTKKIVSFQIFGGFPNLTDKYDYQFWIQDYILSILE